MIYNTGTIAVNGNTATGTGTNFTAPASQVRIGQTLIVLSNPVQMFQITAINSATSLTVTPAASPALSGQKYGILVTDAMSVDGLAQSISQLIKDYDGNIGAWEAFATTTANQNISVTINGANVSIPAIGKLLQKGSNGALSVDQGGTGATTAADSRTNLGLGIAATLDVATSTLDTDINRLLFPGYHGIGGAGVTVNDPGVFATNNNGFFSGPGAGGSNFHDSYMPFLNLVRTSGRQSQLQVSIAGVLATRVKDVDTWRAWAPVWSTVNTTKASDGTLKAASPVARIVSSREENERTDVDEEGFTWCGCGTSNAEAEGINISRLDTGVYVLTGSAGLASEGWQLLPPMDPGGMGELGIVEAEQTGSGGLTIRLFRRKYMLTENGEMVKTKGEPIDVPTNSWIDVRLDMPESSIWNTRIAAASKAEQSDTENAQS